MTIRYSDKLLIVIVLTYNTTVKCWDTVPVVTLLPFPDSVTISDYHFLNIVIYQWI